MIIPKLGREVRLEIKGGRERNNPEEEKKANTKLIGRCTVCIKANSLYTTQQQPKREKNHRKDKNLFRNQRLNLKSENEKHNINKLQEALVVSSVTLNLIQ